MVAGSKWQYSEHQDCRTEWGVFCILSGAFYCRLELLHQKILNIFDIDFEFNQWNLKLVFKIEIINKLQRQFLIKYNLFHETRDHIEGNMNWLYVSWNVCHIPYVIVADIKFKTFSSNTSKAIFLFENVFYTTLILCLNR